MMMKASDAQTQKTKKKKKKKSWHKTRAKIKAIVVYTS